MNVTSIHISNITRERYRIEDIVFPLAVLKV